jgi:hypothetical protein
LRRPTAEEGLETKREGQAAPTGREANDRGRSVEGQIERLGGVGRAQKASRESA